MDAKTIPDGPPRTLPESESAESLDRIIPPFDERVTDTEHRIHQLGPILAKGGQGAVYSTTFAEVAVKLLRDGPLGSELAETIRSVSRLPIRDLPIAMPYSVTRERPGYVMTMVRGMQPVGHLRKHSPRSLALTTSLEWYARAGGLRRRIAVLARIADLLAVLHARGVVYGDLNPNNVMVSADAVGHEIWLIDTDNMKFADDPRGTPYTPGYAAPEHAAFPHLASFESDAFSLLIVAFETITGLRPFLDGRRVAETRPGGQAELDAYQGLLPSVIDPHASNSSEYWLLDRQLLLSPRLLELFEQGFGAGRTDPHSRPAAAELARALWETLDLLCECTSCGFAWWEGPAACPTCHEPVVKAPVVAAGTRSDRAAPIWRGRVGTAGLEVSRRALLVPAASQRRRNGLAAPAVRLSPSRNGVELEGADGVTVAGRELAGRDAIEVTIDGRWGLDLWLESA
jgi:eukaryotic-like serine/threonine-protein kinase